jgi:hypothetical protein
MVRLVAIMCCALVVLMGYWPIAGELSATKGYVEQTRGGITQLFPVYRLLAANGQGLAAAPPASDRQSGSSTPGMADKQMQTVTSIFVGLLVSGYFFLRRQRACMDD